MATIERTLLSYDASGPARSKAARACQIAFGYDQRVTRNGVTRTYRHAGYLDRPGARRVGQSVFLLRGEDAQALAQDLRRLGLRVRTIRIRVAREELSAAGGTDPAWPEHIPVAMEKKPRGRGALVL